jgi:FkbM family methyltransferase
MPAKRFMFSLLKRVWTPPPALYQHLHFRDTFYVDVDNEHGFYLRHYGFEIENDIFWSGLLGGYEKISMYLWINLSRRAKVILDIGANTGIYSLSARSINKEAEIYAFEPVDRVYKRLLENRELNNYNIECLKIAASNYDGTGTIFDMPTEHVYSVTVNKNLQDSTTEVVEKVIQTVKLSTFIEQQAITQIDLVKIDVETHEPEVLEGFEDYLREFSPIFILEVLNNEIGKKIQDLIKDLDYIYIKIDEEHGTERVNEISVTGPTNFLLCPSNKLSVIYEAFGIQPQPCRDHTHSQ